MFDSILIWYFTFILLRNCFAPFIAQCDYCHSLPIAAHVLTCLTSDVRVRLLHGARILYHFLHSVFLISRYGIITCVDGCMRNCFAPFIAQCDYRHSLLIAAHVLTCLTSNVRARLLHGARIIYRFLHCIILVCLTFDARLRFLYGARITCRLLLFALRWLVNLGYALVSWLDGCISMTRRIGFATRVLLVLRAQRMYRAAASGQFRQRFYLGLIFATMAAASALAVVLFAKTGIGVLITCVLNVFTFITRSSIQTACSLVFGTRAQCASQLLENAGIESPRGLGSDFQTGLPRRLGGDTTGVFLIPDFFALTTPFVTAALKIMFYASAAMIHPVIDSMVMRTLLHMPHIMFMSMIRFRMSCLDRIMFVYYFVLFVFVPFTKSSRSSISLTLVLSSPL